MGIIKVNNSYKRPTKPDRNTQVSGTRTLRNLGSPTQNKEKENTSKRGILTVKDFKIGIIKAINSSKRPTKPSEALTEVRQEYLKDHPHCEK